MVDFGGGCWEVKHECLCWRSRVPLQVLFLGLPERGEVLDVRMLRAMVSEGWAPRCGSLALPYRWVGVRTGPLVFLAQETICPNWGWGLPQATH